MEEYQRCCPRFRRKSITKESLRATNSQWVPRTPLARYPRLHRFNKWLRCKTNACCRKYYWVLLSIKFLKDNNFNISRIKSTTRRARRPQANVPCTRRKPRRRTISRWITKWPGAARHIWALPKSQRRRRKLLSKSDGHVRLRWRWQNWLPRVHLGRYQP